MYGDPFHPWCRDSLSYDGRGDDQPYYFWPVVLFPSFRSVRALGVGWWFTRTSLQWLSDRCDGRNTFRVDSWYRRCTYCVRTFLCVPFCTVSIVYPYLPGDRGWGYGNDGLETFLSTPLKGDTHDIYGSRKMTGWVFRLSGSVVSRTVSTRHPLTLHLSNRRSGVNHGYFTRVHLDRPGSDLREFYNNVDKKTGLEKVAVLNRYTDSLCTITLFTHLCNRVL